MRSTTPSDLHITERLRRARLRHTARTLFAAAAIAGGLFAGWRVWGWLVPRERGRLQLVWNSRGMRQTLFDADFSPDGALVATGSCYDPAIQVWRVSDGELLQDIRWPGEAGARTLRFLPDSAHVVAGCFDGSLRLVDARHGGPPRLLASDCSAWSAGLAVRPDGAVVAYARDEKHDDIALRELPAGRLVRSFGKKKEWLDSLLFESDGVHLWSCGHGVDVERWNADTGCREPAPAGIQADCLALAPRGEGVAAGRRDVLSVFPNGRLTYPRSMSLGGSEVYHLRFTPDGRYMLLATLSTFSINGQPVTIRDANSFDLVAKAPDQDSWSHFAVHPHEDSFVTQASDRSLRLYRIVDRGAR